MAMANCLELCRVAGRHLEDENTKHVVENFRDPALSS